MTTEPMPPSILNPIATLTCKGYGDNPTLRKGDKWAILTVRETSLAGFVSYHAYRLRDGMRASISRDVLRLSFKATHFLQSSASRP